MRIALIFQDDEQRGNEKNVKSPDLLADNEFLSKFVPHQRKGGIHAINSKFMETSR